MPARPSNAPSGGKPLSALRIFPSYGHDANEPLVRRIRADLAARGYDVWIDRNNIKMAPKFFRRG